MVRWEQEKSSCRPRLAGEKSWIYSLVCACSNNNTIIVQTLTLGLHWCRGLYRKGGESDCDAVQTRTMR